jgi:hypothetical protein
MKRSKVQPGMRCTSLNTRPWDIVKCVRGSGAGLMDETEYRVIRVIHSSVRRALSGKEPVIHERGLIVESLDGAWRINPIFCFDFKRFVHTGRVDVWAMRSAGFEPEEDRR